MSPQILITSFFLCRQTDWIAESFEILSSDKVLTDGGWFSSVGAKPFEMYKLLEWAGAL